jgi:hypothetical protein
LYCNRHRRRQSLFCKDLAGDLGFEPSCEALRRYWPDVANALFCLRMRKNHRATILNQHWARVGNIFPYFSPTPTGRGRPPRTRNHATSRVCGWLCRACRTPGHANLFFNIARSSWARPRFETALKLGAGQAVAVFQRRDGVDAWALGCFGESALGAEMAIESASRTLASSKDWHGSSYAIEAGPAMRSAPCRDARRSVKAGDSWSQPTWTPLVQPRPRPCARVKPLVGKGSMCRLGTLRTGPWRRARNRSRESGRRMFPGPLAARPLQRPTA